MATTPGPWAASSLFPPLKAYRLARTLAAGVAESVTVPVGARKVILRSTQGVDFYVNGETTATVPTDVTDGSASAVNPAGLSLAGVSTISLISPAACTITLDFYK